MLPQLAILAIPIALAALVRTRDDRTRRSSMTEGSAPPTQAGSIISALPPEYTARRGDPREEMIFTAVRAGLNDPLRFVEVVSHGEVGTPLEAHQLRIPVMNDALKIEGVRVTGSYPLAQRIADELSRDPTAPLVMLTPWVAGLIYEQAAARLSPTTSQVLSDKRVTSDTGQMIEASRKIDEKLAATGAPAGALVANPGKDWVITRRFTEPGRHPESGVPRSQAAANHGFYQAPWRPIQNVGLAHDMAHVDYSQTLRYMAGNATLVLPDQTEVVMAVAELVRDPQLGPLINGPAGVLRGKQVGEGALPYARHPALPGPGGIV